MRTQGERRRGDAIGGRKLQQGPCGLLVADPLERKRHRPPRRHGLPRLIEHDAREVWPDAPQGVRVLNRYFDVTPWSALSGVITEHGLVSPDGIMRLIESIDVSPELLELVP